MEEREEREEREKKEIGESVSTSEPKRVRKGVTCALCKASYKLPL